jgi:hypothetical protein
MINISLFDNVITNLVKNYKKHTGLTACDSVSPYWLYLKPFYKNNKTFTVFYMETFTHGGSDLSIYRERMFIVHNKEYIVADEDEPRNQKMRQLYNALAEKIHKELWKKELREKRDAAEKETQRLVAEKNDKRNTMTLDEIFAEADKAFEHTDEKKT